MTFLRTNATRPYAIDPVVRASPRGMAILGFAVLILCASCLRIGSADEPAATGALPSTQNGMEEARRLLKSAVDRSVVSGVVVHVTQHGQPLLIDAFGQSDLDRRMTSDTIFRIASMTKPITSAAVMMLVEEDKIRLDDPLSRFIPEFGNTRVVGREVGEMTELERPITIHDLLTHTSGIAYGLNPPERLKVAFLEANLADGLNRNDPSLADNMRSLARIPLMHQPGKSFTYGMNTDVLGRVIEVASEQSFDQFLSQRLFVPLKMFDTGFFVPPEKLSRLAAVYRPVTEAGSNRVERVEADSETVGNVTYSTSRVTVSPRYCSGGAGLVSTAADYARFLTMLQRGGELDGVRLLRADSIKAMTTNQSRSLPSPNPKHGDKYGFGFAVVTQPGGTTSVGSFSWGGFYFTYFWVDPKRELVAVFMAQLYPWGGSNLWTEFQTAVYAGLVD